MPHTDTSPHRCSSPGSKSSTLIWTNVGIKTWLVEISTLDIVAHNFPQPSTFVQGARTRISKVASLCTNAVQWTCGSPWRPNGIWSMDHVYPACSHKSTARPWELCQFPCGTLISGPFRTHRIFLKHTISAFLDSWTSSRSSIAPVTSSHATSWSSSS